MCGRLTSGNGVCAACSTSYEKAWCVGKRTETLRKMIDCYKFYNTKAAYWPLAELLLTRIGELPSDIVVTPVPTVSSHIRERGYDHMALVARELARNAHVGYAPLLVRTTTTKQRGENRRQRIVQARVAFAVRRQLPGRTVLLVDDVVTTGATLENAARALRDAGAIVWVAAIARQPLD